jgi:hypothetical protein
VKADLDAAVGAAQAPMRELEQAMREAAAPAASDAPPDAEPKP